MAQSVSTTNCKASCNVTHWMTSWKASSRLKKNQSISLASHPSRPCAEKLMECKSRRSMSLWSFERWFKKFIEVEIQGERSQLTLLFAFPFILWLIFTLLESNLAKFLINIRKKLLVLMIFACSKRGTIARVVIYFDRHLGPLIKAMSYIKKVAIYVESSVCYIVGEVEVGF